MVTSRTEGDPGKPDTISKRPAEENHNAAAEPRGLIAIRSGFAAAPGSAEAASASASRTVPVLESEAIA